MARTKNTTPAVCTVVKTRVRRVKRSLSRNSLDVQGAVVLKKVWRFEGHDNGIITGSEENLSDSETAPGDWCPKHYWFLSTNLLSSQHCTKCTKRILPKRAAYKCTECKKLCHLKCAAANTEGATAFTVTHPRHRLASTVRSSPALTSARSSSSHRPARHSPARHPRFIQNEVEETMDVSAFVAEDDEDPLSETCKYTRKTTTKRHRGPSQRLEPNNNNQTEAELYIPNRYSGEQAEQPESVDTVDGMTQTPDSNGHNSSVHSQAKQRLSSMKKSFVKQCRSIKNKVKDLKDRHTPCRDEQNSYDQEETNIANKDSPRQHTSSSDQVDSTSQEREAWKQSPVRSRLRARQLAIRRESLRAKVQTRRKDENANSNSGTESTLNSGGDDILDVDIHLNAIRDRLDIVEKRVCGLETAIPKELRKWKHLQQKFRGDGSALGIKKARLDDPQSQDTHLKTVEAETGLPSTDCGVSEEAYLITEEPSTSSQEVADHVMHSRDHVMQGPETDNNNGLVTYSPVSANDDSLPSGIPSRFKLNIPKDVSASDSDHQTSTPVTTREISFRAASRNYQNTHRILHTNHTSINVEHAYSTSTEAKQTMDVQSSHVKTEYGDAEQLRTFKTEVRSMPCKYTCLDEVDAKQVTFKQQQHETGSNCQERFGYEKYEIESGVRMGMSPEVIEQDDEALRKVLSPEQEAVKTFLRSRPRRSAGPGVMRSCSPTGRYNGQTGSPRRKVFPRSDHTSPLRNRNQSSFHDSPPIASSTFRESNGITACVYQSELSPVSFSLGPDVGNYRQYQEGDHSASKASEEMKIGEWKNGCEKNTSSNSNLSCTFRNDSQMVACEEDLPGYIRNQSFNRRHNLTLDIQDHSMGDCEPRAQQMVAYEEDLLAQSYSRQHNNNHTPDIRNHNQSLDNQDHNMEEGKSREAPAINFVADTEMDTPRETMRFAMSGATASSTTAASNTDDALSLTNVTEATEDFLNSFNDTDKYVSKSRWVNKDVFQFHQLNKNREQTPEKPNYPLPQVDETGDGRKPPIAVRETCTGIETNFLKEAQRHLDAFKIRRSVENLQCDAGVDETAQTNDDVCLEKLPRQSMLSGSSCYGKSDGNKDGRDPFKAGVDINKGPQPTNIALPLHTANLHDKPISATFLKQPCTSADAVPCTNNVRSQITGSNDMVTSPSNIKKYQYSPTASSRQSKELDPSHIPLATSGDTIHGNSTADFENIEKHLMNESLARKQRLSQSLTQLPHIQLDTIQSHHRQKSVSCANSVDGETRSIINEGARYHFLHEKGMIKISSPSLKLLSRQSREKKFNDIDEESDTVDSASELSGVFVDDRFRITSHSAVTSDMGSRHTKSGLADSEVQEASVYAVPSVVTVSTSSLTQQEKLEHQHLEEYLKTIDDGQENWDNVLRWINERYHSDEADEQAELEQELQSLMKQEGSSQARSGSAKEYSPKNISETAREMLVEKSGGDAESTHEKSVYYSFRGQSEELRNALSPVHGMSAQADVSDNGHTSNHLMPDHIDLTNNDLSASQANTSKSEQATSLMYVIQHGTQQEVSQLLNSDRTISEAEIKEAVVWALETENFEIAMLLLEDVCKLIQAAEEGCVEVFPAYLENHKWQPVFVILSKQDYQGEWDTFMGFRVYRRRYDRVSSEAAKVINSDCVRTHPLSVDDFKIIRRAISSADLQRKHSKITVINACPCKSKKNGEVLELGLCIVVHCLIKGFIPFNEQPFPKSIQGIRVDVREGYFKLGVATRSALVCIQQQTWDAGVFTRVDMKTPEGQGSESEGHKSDSGSCVSEAATRSHGSAKSSHSSQKTSPPSDSSSDSESILSDLSTSESENEDWDKLQDSKPSRLMGPEGAAENIEADCLDAAECTGPAGAMKANSDLVIDNGLDLDASGMIAKDGLIQKAAEVSDSHGEKSKERNQHLLMGTSIGLVGGVSRGTLGGFVLLQGNEMGFITCAHVLGSVNKPEDTGLRSYVCQPATSPPWKPVIRSICGDVVKVAYSSGSCDAAGVDVGVVRITSRNPQEADFIHVTQKQMNEAGFLCNGAASFSAGKVFKWSELTDATVTTPVIKYGAETGLTTGRIYSDGLYVRTMAVKHNMSTEPTTPNLLGVDTVSLYNQIEMTAVPGSSTRFFLPGDSGALVFTYSVDQAPSLLCVGMAVGYTSFGTCVVSPIEDILKALGRDVNFIDFTKCETRF